MKRIGLGFLVAVAVGCTAASSFAQTGLQYPDSVRPVVYDYGAPVGGAASEPSTAPARPAAAPDCSTAAPAPAADSCGCGSCYPAWLNLLGDQCPLNCPDQTTKRLIDNNCWLKCHNITVTGLVEAGLAGRDGPRGDGFNGPDGFNDRDWEGQFNELDTIITKAVKPKECCWDWGFTVETLYGTDYRYPLALGLDARDNGAPKWNSDPRDF